MDIQEAKEHLDKTNTQLLTLYRKAVDEHSRPEVTEALFFASCDMNERYFKLRLLQDKDDCQLDAD